jgi:septal ring factor EnvC (AmiA/AmiB activator)
MNASNTHIKIMIAPILMAMALFFFVPTASAQNISDHKNKISEIEKEIDYLNKQISSTQKKQKNTMEELVFIQKKVSNRKKILSEIDGQLKHQNALINEKDKTIRQLEGRLDTLEFYYRHLVVNTYKYRDSRLWFMYILSSDNIEQGYRRWKYLKNYSNSINRQGEKIKETRSTLLAQKSELLALRNETLKVQQSREKEYKNLLSEEAKSKSYAKKLAANQSKYRKQMEQKRKEAQRLNNEIQKMLAAAVKEKESPKTTTVQKETNIKLSSGFQNNKGKLPWPVKGVVIEKFGQHNHPLFKGVKMPFNNGINISTALNAEVSVVFDGVVKQVIAIPGYNQCVLVQHGSYFTFYCKLANVSVKVGQSLKTGDKLGTLSNTQNTSTLHFELWQGTTKQNPELWLRSNS